MIEQPPYLLCPHHARNEFAPRPKGSARVVEVEVSLQEFDYFGTRPPDIVMFKHATTKRYLDLAERKGRVVWRNYQTGIGVVEREVATGFRQARSS